MMMIWMVLMGCGRPPPAAEAAPLPTDPIQAAKDFAATRPIYEQPLGDGLIAVPGVPTLSSQTCGACHAEIAAEWRTSVHAQAWVDRQYQQEITKSGNKWLCLNCHTPLRTQQAQLAIGLEGGDVERPILVDNPRYDKDLREEGITCAACHVRDGKIHGPGIGGNPPHPVVKDETYRSGALCMRCHQAVTEYPGKNFTCTFNTGKEWQDGPYDDEGTTCVDCHMPPIERPVAAGGTPKTVARHWWRGAGIPKIPGRYPPPEANKFGLDLQAVVVGKELQLTLTNANAGHMLPTGDPERKVRVHLHWETKKGELPGQDWEIGQSWTWNPPTKHGDNRLKPRESRVLKVPIPKGALRAKITAENERISKENLAYHNLENYPGRVQTHDLTVEIR